MSLYDLQASVQDRKGFARLEDYPLFAGAFLRYLHDEELTRIISPTQADYCFFQYPEEHAHRITRPLNTTLFIEDPVQFDAAFERAAAFLEDLARTNGRVGEAKRGRRYLATGELNAVTYTAQQAIGCVGDSFRSPNQARKRIGQLFERLVKLMIQAVGVDCEPRTIRLPVPGFEGYEMPYELDVVFSRSRAIIASETKHIHPHEIVGSVKTTSKDRIDKIFLDKFMLRRLLGRDVPVVALFLHDVQRASRGRSIFGVASTFKKNHFLGYTVALNRLDGVYFVDPRPEMYTEARLREQIADFQRFISRDLWRLTEP